MTLKTRPPRRDNEPHFDSFCAILHNFVALVQASCPVTGLTLDSPEILAFDPVGDRFAVSSSVALQADGVLFFGSLEGFISFGMSGLKPSVVPVFIR